MKRYSGLAVVIFLAVCGGAIYYQFQGRLSQGKLAELERALYTEGIAQPRQLQSWQTQFFGRLMKAASKEIPPSQLRITYPRNRSLFPPDFIPPTFQWIEFQEKADVWLLNFHFDDSSNICLVTRSRPSPPFEIDSSCILKNMTLLLPKQSKHKTWTPPESIWDIVKKRAVEKPVRIEFFGFNSTNIRKPLSRGQVSVSISRDSVGAPIFYRDVPVMPVKNETGIIMPIDKIALPLVKWRLRDVSRPRSKVVMQEIPTCANCHSFSNDGKWMGSDIDGPESDKGGYALAPISRKMSVSKREIFSWNYDFSNNPTKRRTIGFLSSVSPNGDYVATTLNEELFVIGYLTPKYLQVFYPTRGILAIFSKKTGKIKILPGADNTDFVHCNPVWTPDGKEIIFCRAPARAPYTKGQKMPAYANGPEETPIQYDLYRIPFNRGKGGKAEPVKGASSNGMSNNFAKVSPDGKFIVFVKCRNGLLMRPDSKLWIVPAGGGEARKMNCNTERMNSWHSWSPNSRWLVFSSKMNTFYTQMFLTHIDAQGNDSPPILVPNSKADNRAVNIPEFVNIRYEELKEITVPAVNHYWTIRRADSLITANRYPDAVSAFVKALKETDDKRVRAHIMVNLGGLLDNSDEAVSYLQKAIQIHPDYAESHFILGARLEKQGHLRRAVESYYNTLRHDPGHSFARIRLAKLYIVSDDPAIRNPEKALRLAEEADDLTHHRDVAALRTRAMAYSENGRYEDALVAAQDALRLAQSRDLRNDIPKIENEIRLYRLKRPFSSIIVRKPS